MNDSFDDPLSVLETMTESEETASAKDGENEGIDITMIKGKYVLVEFIIEQQQPYHYVGQVKELVGEENVLINFLRLQEGSLKNTVGLKVFKEPQNKDEFEVSVNQIKKVINEVKITRGIRYIKEHNFGNLLIR